MSTGMDIFGLLKMGKANEIKKVIDKVQRRAQWRARSGAGFRYRGTGCARHMADDAERVAASIADAMLRAREVKP